MDLIKINTDSDEHYRVYYIYDPERNIFAEKSLLFGDYIMGHDSIYTLYRDDLSFRINKNKYFVCADGQCIECTKKEHKIYLDKQKKFMDTFYSLNGEMYSLSDIKKYNDFSVRFPSGETYQLMKVKFDCYDFFHIELINGKLVPVYDIYYVTSEGLKPYRHLFSLNYHVFLLYIPYGSGLIVKGKDDMKIIKPSGIYPYNGEEDELVKSEHEIFKYLSLMEKDNGILSCNQD